MIRMKKHEFLKVKHQHFILRIKFVGTEIKSSKIFDKKGHREDQSTISITLVQYATL